MKMDSKGLMFLGSAAIFSIGVLSIFDVAAEENLTGKWDAGVVEVDCDHKGKKIKCVIAGITTRRSPGDPYFNAEIKGKKLSGVIYSPSGSEIDMTGSVEKNKITIEYNGRRGWSTKTLSRKK